MVNEPAAAERTPPAADFSRPIPRGVCARSRTRRLPDQSVSSRRLLLAATCPVACVFRGHLAAREQRSDWPPPRPAWAVRCACWSAQERRQI